MVFISHSFGDDARFDDLCNALEQRRVPFWNPKEMRAGSSLREQLRSAIETCDICIFIATRKSVESSWCGAELGAFWGSGKKVVVYVADDSLKDDDLPQQFSGDIWLRKIRDVVQEAKQTLEEISRTHQLQQQQETRLIPVGELSVGKFIDILLLVFQPFEGNLSLAETMARLAAIVGVTHGAILRASVHIVRVIEHYLKILIGKRVDALREFGKGGDWKHHFTVQTSSGRWVGYSIIHNTYAQGDVEVYSGCLIVHLRNGAIHSAAVVTELQTNDRASPTKYEVGKMIAREGDILPGEMTGLGAFDFVDNIY